MEEEFWADVHVDEPEPGVFVPVLVMGLGGAPEDVVRLTLDGTYPTPDAARNAALESITEMALDSGKVQPANGEVDHPDASA